MADITDVKPGERTIQIKHPGTGEDFGVEVDLRSLDDDAVKGVRRKIADRALYLEARGKSFKAEELEQNQYDLALAGMTGWRWNKDADGEQNTFHGEIPEFNRKNVMAVFNEIPWFHRQVAKEFDEEKDFFAASKPN